MKPLPSLLGTTSSAWTAAPPPMPPIAPTSAQAPTTRPPRTRVDRCMAWMVAEGRRTNLRMGGELVVQGPVAAQPVVRRHEDALQHLVLAREEPGGVAGLVAREEASAAADGGTGGLAGHRGGCDLD